MSPQVRKPSLAFWRRKTVLVTGAGGFIGSHVCEALVRAGAEVNAFLRYTSHRSTGALQYADPRLTRKMALHYGDARMREDLLRAAQCCDAIIHLAAMIGIPYSYQSPRATMEDNALGTLAALEAARELGVSRMVHISTSEVYGSAQRTPMDETHPLNAQSPYAASKIAADQLALSFHRSFGLPVVIVRPFNTYGPRQSLRAVIPTIIAQALRGPTVRLGSLTPVRDLTYVEDTAEGMLAVGACEKAIGETVNLGTGMGVAISDLARRIGPLVGHKLRIQSDGRRIRPPGSEIDRLISDPAKALKLAGWRARLSMEEGLKRTIAFYKSHPPELAEGYVR